MELMSKKTAWDIVMLARDAQRPKAKDYIESIVDDFIEFHGDRAFVLFCVLNARRR